MTRPLLTLLVFLVAVGAAQANPPSASYLFPAGGQRGTTVKVRVGGLFLHEKCAWELIGPDLTTSPTLTRARTLWVEGPMLPLPDSQRQEDYPRDMLGEVRIGPKAPPGSRRFRLWTSEGAASGPTFVVGDLPEVVETEIEDNPTATQVQFPVTINGRIFPHQNIDRWSFAVRTGQTITCEVHAARIGSPLDSRLEVRGPDGRIVAENDDYHGTDSLVSFTAQADGLYQARIQDSQRGGSQRHVYRLTITTGPHVRHVYPLGGRRGTKVALQVSGEGLPAKAAEILLPKDAPPRWSGSIMLGKQRSSPVTLDVDDLPEQREVEPNNKDSDALTVAWPAVLNGQIDRPGDVDVWRIAAKKGETLSIDLRASRLGSRLDGVVELAKADGTLVQRLERDGEMLVAIAKDGDYLLRIRDRFHSRGGPAFGYRLRVDRPRPGFSLTLSPDALTAQRGKPATVPLKIDRMGGFSEAINLRFSGLPAEVKVTPDKVPAGATSVALTFTPSKEAKIGVARITVSGSAVRKDGNLSATTADDLLLGVGLTAPFKLVGSYDQRNAPRGSVFRKHFTIERHGFAGPLEASLADRQARHLQGVVGPRLAINAGRNEFDYPVTLPPWMEIGRTSRACVMLTGKVRDGGVEHVVSSSSQEQKEQIIAVVETGRLGLEVGRKSLAVVPGKSVSLPIEVRRGKGLTGVVEVECVLTETMQGVTAKKLMLAAGQSKGTLEVQFAARIEHVHLPVVVRATLSTTDGPVTAEATVELVAP